MRTKKATINFFISVIFTTALAVLGLVKSKCFLINLGDDQTGIYQLFSQIYSYISLVDAGLTGSLLFSLYKPISENNYNKINQILKAGRNFFAIIGLIIIFIGLLLSFKIDFFISYSLTSINYIQASFILFIIASALNYFATARKVLFEAKQDLYIVHIVVYSTMILKGILEIVLVYIGFKLLSLMVLFLIMSILQNILIFYLSKRKYKFYNNNCDCDYSFKKESKNLIFQKIGGIVFNNVDIILVSKYISTSSIVIYTSYNYIINCLLNIFKKLGSGTLASVGNLLVTEKDKAKSIFLEFNSLCFYIANVISVPLLFCITPFVRLYFGSNYVLSVFGMICMVTLFYIKIINMPIDVFINALGYFKKIRNIVIIEAIINLILSLLFVFKYGIGGVVLATIISYLCCEFTFFPLIMNKDFFIDNKIPYFKHSIKLLSGSVFGIIINYFIFSFIDIKNIFVWFGCGVLSFIVNLITTTLYFYLVKELKFMERFKQLIPNFLLRGKK